MDRYLFQKERLSSQCLTSHGFIWLVASMSFECASAMLVVNDLIPEEGEEGAEGAMLHNHAAAAWSLLEGSLVFFASAVVSFFSSAPGLCLGHLGQRSCFCSNSV